MLFNNQTINKVTLNTNKSKGFTLIEMIIGIVVFAISLGIVVQYFGPAEKNSADQIHQIKASELGQALLDDIMSRSFDENSDRSGGIIRCLSNNGTDNSDKTYCTPLNAFGPDDGEAGNIALFDDVDDFDELTEADLSLDSSYNSFKVVVSVIYDATDVRLSDYVAKRILVTITTPLGTDIKFAIFKTNF